MSGRRLLSPASILGLAIGAAIAGHARPARAADPPAPPESSSASVAEHRAAEAYDAYSRKDYASAVALYLQAFDASPSAVILLNVARIYDTKLADRPLAMTFYRRYISDPGADVEHIKIANLRLTELKTAEAMTSEAPADSAASRPSLPSRAAAPPVSDADRGGWSAVRWTGLSLGGLGLGGIVVGAVYGVTAAAKTSTARQSCDGSQCTTQGGVDAARAAAGDATVSNVGFIAGGALLAAGTALFLIGGDRKAEPAQSAKIGWDVSAGSSSFAVGVKGAW